MTDYYSLMKEILDDLICNVVGHCSELDDYSIPMFDGNDSLCGSHPLPCSQDFQFFTNIAYSKEDHSPDWFSSQEFNDISPPADIAWSPDTRLWSQQSTDPQQTKSQIPAINDINLVSSGVPLLPLTQAPIGHEMIEVDSSENEFEFSSPPSKRTRFYGNISKRPSFKVDLSTDEDYLPLTFHTKADLIRKLQKAAKLPVQFDMPIQNSPDKILDNIKQESSTNVFGYGSTEESPGGEPEKFCNYEGTMDDKPEESLPAEPKVKLLNKAPRIGLSKRHRGIHSLHEVSIIMKKEE